MTRLRWRFVGCSFWAHDRVPAPGRSPWLCRGSAPLRARRAREVPRADVRRSASGRTRGGGARPASSAGRRPGGFHRRAPCCSSTSSPTAAQLAAFEAFRTHNNPNFDVGHNQILYSQFYFTAVPLLLAVVGGHVIEDRRLALALLTGMIGAPVYHLLTGNPSGDQKHVVFGLLFILPADRRNDQPRAAPVAGGHRGARVGRARAVRSGAGDADRRGLGGPARRRSTSSRTTFAPARNCSRAPHGWRPHTYTTEAASFLQTTSTTSIASSISASRVDVCDFDWFVEIPGGEPWPPAIRRAVERCGFQRVYESSATLTGLGSNLRFVTYRAPIEIWERARGAPYADDTCALE